MPRKLRAALLVLLGLALASALSWLGLQNSGLLQPKHWDQPPARLALISTRNSLADDKLQPGRDRYYYSLTQPFPGMGPDPSAPADLMIVIHGFNNTADKALTRFANAGEGLAAAGFSGAVVGYSWDADTQHDPLSATGYHEGMRNAAANGPMLAQFLADYHDRNPQTRLHLIGYSMGARLALETLYALATDEHFAAIRPGVATLHLVGAAVENEDVELDERYGPAIASCCGAAYNYFSRNDGKLGWFYPLKEGDRALGLTGVEHPQRAPANYFDVDSAAELPPYDISGQPTGKAYGNNHSGYLGTRDASGKLVDDGVMDLVAARIAAGPGQPGSQ